MVKRFTILLIIALVSAILTGFWVSTKNISTEGLVLRVLSLTHAEPPRYGFGVQKEAASSHRIWSQELAKYVDDKGGVNYNQWSRNDSMLNVYLKSLSDHPPHKGWSEVEEMAYWINAYNAFTIRLVLNHYPVESIKDIGGNLPMINSPWDISFIDIGKRKLSLNDIEHFILRKHFDEPRIHFAINCASISCPVLSREAFTSENLEDLLTIQTKAFMLDHSKNDLSGQSQLVLSPIFKWFSEDFKSSEDIIGMVNAYGFKNYPPDISIQYNNYNWALNKQ